ncbi:unnamed protein product [Trichobilharzia regenti]|nr:unnamed protein product [Trichobilharzia regenti]
MNIKPGPIVYYHNPRNSDQSNYSRLWPLNPYSMNSTWNVPPTDVKPSYAIDSKNLELNPLDEYEYAEFDPLGPFDEDAPPLPPLRPTTFDASPYQLLNACTQIIDKQRPKSPSTLSTFTNNFNDTTSYHQPSGLQSEQLPSVSIIKSSTFDNNDNNSDKPTDYPQTTSISNVQ